MPSIPENIKNVRKAIEQACIKSSRNPDEVRIIAIGKGFQASHIEEVVKAGILEIGENYLQEALPKQEVLKSLPIQWHFTGHLQRNKAFLVANHFSLIQSVDSFRLAKTLEEAGEKAGKEIQILLQVKRGPEAPHGFSFEELRQKHEELFNLDRLRILGMMTLGLPVDEPEKVRPFFKETKKFLEELKKNAPVSFKELSMGMSGDFQVAVEEGATMVRIGTVIFGKRSAKRE